MSEKILAVEALEEHIGLLEEMNGRYRRSNTLLRKINSLLRRQLAIPHSHDETFKAQCASPAVVETYWGDPSGSIRRMSGEQEIIARATDACTNEEYLALSNITTNMESGKGGLPESEPSPTDGVQHQGGVSND